MKTNHFNYKGYTGNVEYNEVDNCLYGKVEGLAKALITYQGKSIDELESDFKEAVDDYLEFCVSKGMEPQRPFSGKLSLRLTPELHYLVSDKAKRSGDSLNNFIVKTLQKELVKI